MKCALLAITLIGTEDDKLGDRGRPLGTAFLFQLFPVARSPDVNANSPGATASGWGRRVG